MHHYVVMIARASIISESEVSIAITVPCLLGSQQYESRTVRKACP